MDGLSKLTLACGWRVLLKSLSLHLTVEFTTPTKILLSKPLEQSHQPLNRRRGSTTWCRGSKERGGTSTGTSQGLFCPTAFGESSQLAKSERCHSLLERCADKLAAATTPNTARLTLRVEKKYLKTRIRGREGASTGMSAMISFYEQAKRVLSCGVRRIVVTAVANLAGRIRQMGYTVQGYLADMNQP